MNRYRTSLLIYMLLLSVTPSGTSKAGDLAFYFVNGQIHCLDFEHPKYDSTLSLTTTRDDKEFDFYGTASGLYIEYVSKQDSSEKYRTVNYGFLDPPSIIENRIQRVFSRKIEQGDGAYFKTYRYKCLLLVPLTHKDVVEGKYAVIRNSRILDTILLHKQRFNRELWQYEPNVQADSSQLNQIIIADQTDIDGSIFDEVPCSSVVVAKLRSGELGIYDGGMLQSKIKLDCMSDIVLNRDETIVRLFSNISNISNNKFVVQAQVYVINSRNERFNREYFFMLLCSVHGDILRTLITPFPLLDHRGIAFLSW